MKQPPTNHDPPQIAVDLDGDGATDRQGWDAGRDGDVRYIAVHDPLPPPEPIKLTIPNLLARNKRSSERVRVGWLLAAALAAFYTGLQVGLMAPRGTVKAPASNSAELLREWTDKSRSDVYFSLTPAEREKANAAIRADAGGEK